MNKLFLAVLAAGMLHLTEVGLLRAEATMYSVYCANDRIEVDMRTLEQMKSARGGDVCMFGQFTSYSSALDLADKQFGGVGAKCTCGD